MIIFKKKVIFRPKKIMLHVPKLQIYNTNNSNTSKDDTRQVSQPYFHSDYYINTITTTTVQKTQPHTNKERK